MIKILIISVLIVVYLLYGGGKYAKLYRLYTFAGPRSVGTLEYITMLVLWRIGWPVVAYLVAKDKHKAKKIKTND
jgi:hypothetical protein